MKVPVYEIITDRPTDRVGHRKVPLPINILIRLYFTKVMIIWNILISLTE